MKQMNAMQKKHPHKSCNHKDCHHKHDLQPAHSPEHLLGEFFKKPPMPLDLRHSEDKWLEPDIEISETKKDIIVAAELPGMDPEEIQVNVSQDGYLTISGEKQHHTTETDEHSGAYFSEFSYGTMQRTVPLPADLNYDAASASFENGVLSVRIPKTEEATRKVKKVPVQKKQ